MSFRASADQEKLLQSFSLEGLCQAKDTGAQKTDMLCQWRGEEDREYRYMVKSTPEQGAAFTVTVILRLQNPNENPELPDLSQSDISDVSFLGYRILLVEDNELLRSHTDGHSDAGTIPILTLSANISPEDIAAGRDCGMNEHIAKPLNIPQLIERMHYLSFLKAFSHSLFFSITCSIVFLPGTFRVRHYL